MKQRRTEGSKKKNPAGRKSAPRSRPSHGKSYRRGTKQKDEATSSLIRLNKYLSNAGICSRREADTLIAAGNVSVNGKVVTEMGYKVSRDDVVKFDGRVISPEKKEYVLLNKPKNHITTTRDEKGRRTVMELISNASKSRLLPVGRLDRNTTGLLLFTNDGDLAKKLTHPSHGIRKIYHVELDKNLTMSDFRKIQSGPVLEDGPVEVDDLSYIENKSKREIGIELHSGRNRIVRRIFENFGYRVVKLDRVVIAGLTKKDLPRGHWRFLTPQEIINLKILK